ncbi:MAG: YraN family protein [Cyanobacteria bacterium P01_H01_bin.121]
MAARTSSATSTTTSTTTVTASPGWQGEQLVARWLQQQGWSILQHRWRSRGGELDLIASGWVAPAKNSVQVQETAQVQSHPAQHPRVQQCLAFIEVKTRSRGNWDADGLLAITPNKQARLLRAAQLYLNQYPRWANFPCRFDIALVRCQSAYKQNPSAPVAHNPSEPDGQTDAQSPAVTSSPILIGHPQLMAGYRLTLLQYLPNAFDGYA